MKYLVQITFLMIILVSCQKSKDLTTVAPLDGQWQMQSYIAFMPTLPVLAENDVVWTINSQNNTIIVVNQVINAHPYLLESGTYPFTATSNTLTIEGITYDLELGLEEMTLFDHPYSDGPTIKFIKL